MTTIVFYLEQRASTGPDLSPWFNLKSSFGVELVAIDAGSCGVIKHNDHTSQVKIVPSVLTAYAMFPDATRVFLSEGAEAPVSNLPSPQGDVVYFFGRNSRGFRNDLEGMEDLTFGSLPGGDLFAHEAARELLNG